MEENNEIVIDDNVESQVIETLSYFTSPIFKISMPQYVDIVREVGEEAIEMLPEDIQPSELNTSKQSASNLQVHTKIQEFGQKAIHLAWHVLKIQGYDMQKFTTYYESMWLQEHHKMSVMEQHIHNSGVQLVGFYFLNVPENSSRLVFHDPRPGKVQINLPESNPKDVTFASQMINFEPKVGDLFFAPAWLPHSFSRHGNDEMLKFVHINVLVQTVPQITQNHTCVNEPVII
jgi:uncharacterized protein (TIGR02466 family)